MIHNFNINSSTFNTRSASLTQIVTSKGNNKVGVCMTRDYQIIDNVLTGNIVLPVNSEFEKSLLQDDFKTKLMICVRTPDLAKRDNTSSEFRSTLAHYVIDLMDIITSDLQDRNVLMTKIKDSSDILTIITIPMIQNRDDKYYVIKKLISLLNLITNN